MNRSSCVALLAFTALASQACSSVARDAASRAPEAKPPEIVRVGARRFPNDPVYYGSGGGFDVVLKQGLFNELLVTEDGTTVPLAASWPPTAVPPVTVYRSLERTDNVDVQTTQVRLHLVPVAGLVVPFVPPPDGTVKSYSFVERSINPTYANAGWSAPSEVRITIWNKKPAVVLFDVSPAQPATNVPLHIAWRATDTKQVELLEMTLEPVTLYVSGHVPPIQTTRPKWTVLETHNFETGAAGGLEGERDLNVTPLTRGVMIRARGAGGEYEQRDAYFTPTDDVRCPQNPGGRKSWFDFCKECLGQPPTPAPEYACNEDEARQQAKDWVFGTNCTIVDGACFTP
jgi:hypothetical protein